MLPTGTLNLVIRSPSSEQRRAEASQQLCLRHVEVSSVMRKEKMYELQPSRHSQTVQVLRGLFQGPSQLLDSGAFLGSFLQPGKMFQSRHLLNHVQRCGSFPQLGVPSWAFYLLDCSTSGPSLLGPLFMKTVRL